MNTAGSTSKPYQVVSVHSDPTTPVTWAIFNYAGFYCSGLSSEAANTLADKLNQLEEQVWEYAERLGLPYDDYVGEDKHIEPCNCGKGELCPLISNPK